MDERKSNAGEEEAEEMITLARDLGRRLQTIIGLAAASRSRAGELV